MGSLESATLANRRSSRLARSLLEPGEQLILAARKHWIIYAPPLGMLVTGSATHTPLCFDLGILVLLAVIRIHSVGMFALTNRRFIVRSGILSDRGFELWIPHLEGIEVGRNPVSGALGFQTIVVHRTDGLVQRYRFVARATELGRRAGDQITRVRRDGLDVPPPSAPPAGWLADPAGRHEVRFWDGERWTAMVATKGVRAVDPPG